ncbi:MAG: glutamate--tRNA ligase [Gemmatimonadota bacterium]|nr:glutamate--tRNA ligase [Gemmatimonadota bacterium]MDP6460673.1 glutamate--tRNA ligase [Gemmatimonadota bacterium]MDP7032232.1 glutamate--tRNA ligase [Gemmatimonadota bacterium]
MRVRFAPSPTGTLHVGGARTALYNWALARASGGTLILRVEDTDEERSTPESEESVLADLRWLGIGWDEGPDVGGAHAPYRQSERVGLHREAVEELLASGAAYRCWATDADLDAAREKVRAAGGSYRHDRTRHDISPDEEERRLAAGEHPAVRLAVPGGDSVLKDRIRGEVRFPEGMVGDFILLRSSGVPTYNLACALDDAAMGITLVVRGEEHLSNTVKQRLVLEALGREVPEYAHLPLILDTDRSKLSKRSGGATVRELRERGFLAEAVVNVLALQGWHPEGDEDRFSPREFVESFDLSKVRKAAGIYDMERMRALNGNWLRETPPEDLADRLAPFLAARGLDPALAARAAACFASGAHDLAEVAEIASGFSVSPEVAPLPDGLDEEEAARALDAVRTGLGSVEAEPPAGFLRPLIREAGREAGVKGRALFLPVRLALTGAEHGPDLPHIGDWLGPAQCEDRIGRALAAWRGAEESA